MLTFDKMQNSYPLMYTTIEILGQSVLEVLARTPNIQNYAYSMKSLNNFPNAQSSVFKVFSHLRTVVLHLS